MQPTASDLPAGYELIDFGNQRKLESFGGVIVDRPCPAAIGEPSSPDLWSSAQLIYDKQSAREVRRNTWLHGHKQKLTTNEWMCGHRGFRFLVRPQSTGQLGLFPEHWQLWDWIEHQLHNRCSPPPARVLHLFAYTGTTSLAIARMGAEVTHVDAMESAVAWGRVNAERSHVAHLPIRWIVEDARTYVRRELQRGRTYDLILLDPPSYGHGARGQAWQIQRDLSPLLVNCWKLLSDRGIGVILSGHSPDIHLRTLLAEILSANVHRFTARLETEQAALTDRIGRKLDCGYVARFLANHRIDATTPG